MCVSADAVDTAASSENDVYRYSDSYPYLTTPPGASRKNPSILLSSLVRGAGVFVSSHCTAPCYTHTHTHTQTQMHTHTHAHTRTHTRTHKCTHTHTHTHPHTRTHTHARTLHLIYFIFPQSSYMRYLLWEGAVMCCCRRSEPQRAWPVLPAREALALRSHYCRRRRHL